MKVARDELLFLTWTQLSLLAWMPSVLAEAVLSELAWKFLRLISSAML